MPLEKIARPLAAGEWPPPASEPRPVSETDDWWTLAREAGWADDPWRLIDFNFKTRNAMEVNYYLRTLVGCSKRTPDGKNWMFNSAAKPGIVYLPKAAVPRPPQKARPTVDDIDNWFKQDLVPRRTASSGFSFNRFWKTPAALGRGHNKPDPNGLCGDTMDFFVQEYKAKFGTDEAEGDRMLGNVVWESDGVGNHVAMTIVPMKSAYPQLYRSQSVYFRPKGQDALSTMSAMDLMNTPVWDLYYKKRTTLQDWWYSLNDSYSGSITLML